jgi:hypothetical protein
MKRSFGIGQPGALLLQRSIIYDHEESSGSTVMLNPAASGMKHLDFEILPPGFVRIGIGSQLALLATTHNAEHGGTCRR